MLQQLRRVTAIVVFGLLWMSQGTTVMAQQQSNTEQEGIVLWFDPQFDGRQVASELNALRSDPSNGEVVMLDVLGQHAHEVAQANNHLQLVEPEFRTVEEYAQRFKEWHAYDGFDAISLEEFERKARDVGFYLPQDLGGQTTISPLPIEQLQARVLGIEQELAQATEAGRDRGVLIAELQRALVELRSSLTDGLDQRFEALESGVGEHADRIIADIGGRVDALQSNSPPNEQIGSSLDSIRDYLFWGLIAFLALFLFLLVAFLLWWFFVRKSDAEADKETKDVADRPNVADIKYAEAVDKLKDELKGEQKKSEGDLIERIDKLRGEVKGGDDELRARIEEAASNAASATRDSIAEVRTEASAATHNADRALGSAQRLDDRVGQFEEGLKALNERVGDVEKVIKEEVKPAVDAANQTAGKAMQVANEAVAQVRDVEIIAREAHEASTGLVLPDNFPTTKQLKEMKHGEAIVFTIRLPGEGGRRTVTALRTFRLTETKEKKPQVVRIEGLELKGIEGLYTLVAADRPSLLKALSKAVKSDRLKEAA